jgi:hypothetical protein
LREPSANREDRKFSGETTHCRISNVGLRKVKIKWRLGEIFDSGEE